MPAPRSPRDRLSAALPALDAMRDGVDGWRWWARDEAIAGACADWGPDLTRGGSAQLTRLARSRRRASFAADAAGRSAFVKLFELVGLRRRLRATLGLGPGPLGIKSPVIECANTDRARRVLPNVPAVLAFGERRSGLLADLQVIVFERLEDVVTLEARIGEGGDPRPVLARAFELAATLAAARFLHLDLNARNVLCGESPEDDRIVDFELCAKGSDPSEVLAFYLGNLYRSRLCVHLDEATYDAAALPHLDEAQHGAYAFFKRERLSFRARRRRLGSRF